MSDFQCGLIIGAIIAAMTMLVITNACTGEAWRVEAVAHGYAHFTASDSSWHWNNEGKP